MSDDVCVDAGSAAQHQDLTLILDSPLFDALHLYPERTRREAAEAYLGGIAPAAQAGSLPFDPPFYALLYPDVAAAGLNGLVHYLRFGRAEGRLPSRAALRALAAECRAASLLGTRHYPRSTSVGLLPDLTDAEDYILYRLSRGESGDRFDPVFYGRHYMGNSAPPIIALAHYLRVGRFRGYYTTSALLERDALVIAPAIDVAHYVRQTGLDSDPLVCARDYLTRGSISDIAPSPDFGPDYYRRNNPDIIRRQTEPFVHYVMHGRTEGRCGYPDFGGMYRGGGVPYHPDRPTIVVAVHEASITGAPLVALALARALRERYNIIVYIPHDLGLLSDLTDASIFVIVGRLNILDCEYLLRQLRATHAITAVLANSVETLPLVLAALAAGVPTVSLVHEFSEYSKPAGKVAQVVIASDRAIVPIAMIKASAQRDVGTHFDGVANNIRIRAQGQLPARKIVVPGEQLTGSQILDRLGRSTKPRIVLGAGYFQIRKGIDFFVRTAFDMRRRSGEDVVFLWVGAGYYPYPEMGYAFWISEDIKRLGLTNHVFIVDQQDSLDTLFGLADVFYLPSRLDPFPNVALDAMAAGKPVICFDDGTGVTALIGPERGLGTVVPYGNTAQAADAIAAMFDRKADAAEINPSFIRTHFDFADYADFVDATIDEAVRHRAVQHAAEARIAASGMFDAAFHDADPLSGSSAASAISRYVAATQKGTTGRNPRPGFSNDLFRMTLEGNANDGICPFAVALESLSGNAVPQTHIARYSTGSHGGRLPDAGIGLHLHIADAAMARPLLLHIDRIRVTIALYITVTTEEDRVRVAAIALDLNHGLADLIVASPCPLAALVMTIDRNPSIQKLGLFGHVHDLGTDPVSGFGSHADYLHFEALLGLQHALEIFDRFCADPALGLIFVEDPRASGWSGHRPTAQALVQQRLPALSVPDFVHAPVGGMFWARPAAIKSLSTLATPHSAIISDNMRSLQDQPEAIHRLLPALTRAADLNWETTYVSSESEPWSSGTKAPIADATILQRGQFLHPPAN